MRRAANETNRTLNILTLPLDGVFEHILARGLPAYRFYVPQEAGALFADIRALPNLCILKQPLQRLPINIDFDLIVANNRLDARVNVQALGHQLHLPVVFFEHSDYGKQIIEEDIANINKSFANTFVIYTSTEAKDFWDKEGICVDRKSLENKDQLGFSVIDSTFLHVATTPYIRK